MAGGGYDGGEGAEGLAQRGEVAGGGDAGSLDDAVDDSFHVANLAEGLAHFGAEQAIFDQAGDGGLALVEGVLVQEGL